MHGKSKGHPVHRGGLFAVLRFLPLMFMLFGQENWVWLVQVRRYSNKPSCI